MQIAIERLAITVLALIESNEGVAVRVRPRRLFEPGEIHTSCIWFAAMLHPRRSQRRAPPTNHKTRREMDSIGKRMVGAPFADIAAHVKQTEIIWFQTVDWPYSIIRVATVPR